MYTTILAIHNLIRWVVLILGLYALVRSITGWRARRSWSDQDRKAGVFFGAAIDTQLLLGLVLYFFLSPITRAALADFGAVMSDAGLRFFALEHAFYMLLAVVFAHLGSALAKRAPTDAAKHQRGMIWYGLAFLVILLGMPWMRSLIPVF
jgi:hypothetical protein